MKNQGKYGEHTNEKKKSKREVISYEDMPLDEYESEQARISKPAVKRILMFAGIFLVLCLIVIAVANRNNLTPEKIGNWWKYSVQGSKNDGFPVDIQGSEISKSNFVYNNNITYVSDTAFVSLGSDGNEITYSQNTYATPVMRTSGDKVLLYNLGGKGYSTGTESEISKKKETTEDIFTGDINSEGDYCIVTKADGYLSKLIAYNSSNEKLYTYSFSKYYITSVAINSNGTGCVASGITGKNGSVSIKSYVLDFGQEKPVATFNLKDSNIYESKYLDKGTACIIGSQASYLIKGSSELKTVSYNQQQLTAYDINSDTDTLALSLSRSGDGRKCTLECVNNAGDVTNKIKTELACTSMDLYKNRIGVLHNDQCYLYTTDGEFLGKSTEINGIKAIRLDSPSTAYVMGVNQIKRVTEFTK